MKKLLNLLLIIMSINLYGQDRDSSNIIIKKLINEYEQYKQECYNDSTVIHQYKYIKSYSLFLESDGGYKMIPEWSGWIDFNDWYINCKKGTFYEPSDYKERTIYKHLHEPTFEDFMEWLNNK